MYGGNTMRKVVLFIAMSLDGYIADENGRVDWLEGQDPDAETRDTYAEFIEDVDTVIMGWNTYHQVATELSPDEWAYHGLVSYVVTHRELPSTEEIIFTGKSPCSIVEELRQEEGKNIWVCGGADIIRQMMESDQIDEYYISVIPTILGKGIRLFGADLKERKLQLIHTQSYNGITDLVYTRRTEPYEKEIKNGIQTGAMGKGGEKGGSRKAGKNMRILVDADACPVVPIVERMAKRYKIPVTLLCDTSHVLHSDYSEVKVVGAGADAVDFALVGICRKDDLVVTQDYGVAAMILGKGAFGIHQSGKWYTDGNIDQMLMERHLSKKARHSKSKHHFKKTAKRTAEDNIRFAESLERLIKKIKTE